MAFLEADLKVKSNLFIAGVDEVGRGPLAGPVVSCACVFNDDFKKIKKSIKVLESLGVTDSKKLTTLKRKKILGELGLDVSKLKFSCPNSFKVGDAHFEFSISEMSSQKIDEINILQASLLSMSDALNDLKVIETNCLIWIDGNKVPAELKKHKNKEALVKGDSRSLLIALASIIAKEKRDVLMESLSEEYPGYGFEKHAGYPTKSHKEAIKKLGVTPIHRKTFKGVKEFVFEESFK